MDDQDKARLTELLQRQKRKASLPAVRRAWEKRGVAIAPLSDDRHKELVAWLRANWPSTLEPVTGIHSDLSKVVGGHDFMILMDFWGWEEAVAALVPAKALSRTEQYLREIYPDGFLIADQQLKSGLLVNFEDKIIEVSRLGSWKTA
jgi:hypothetical protein